MGLAPYLNLDVGGSETWAEWAVCVFEESFVDQKFMGLFSLLVGVGILCSLIRSRPERRIPSGRVCGGTPCCSTSVSSST